MKNIFYLLFCLSVFPCHARNYDFRDGHADAQSKQAFAQWLRPRLNTNQVTVTVGGQIALFMPNPLASLRSSLGQFFKKLISADFGPNGWNFGQGVAIPFG